MTTANKSIESITFGRFACEIRTASGGIYCRPYASKTQQWERYRDDNGLEIFTGYCLEHHGETLSAIAQREQERIEAANRMTPEQERAWVARVIAAHAKVSV